MLWDAAAPGMMHPRPAAVHQAGGAGLLGPPGAARRLLPPTPAASLEPAGLVPQQHRRASSPRQLPTPPPSQPHRSASPSPPGLLLQMQASGKERRPSSGRRLPAAPACPSPPASAASLCRSASARNPHLQTRSAAQLPPTAPRCSVSSEMESRPLQDRLVPDPLKMPPKQLNSASSAPQSPKENVELPPGYKRQRKCSFNVDLGTDSLSRNGSMAHLLEQQHLLRREFNATPESTPYSNPSSLSPSIEQLNLAGSSKDSSDGEDPNQHGLDPSLYTGTGGRRQSSCSSVLDVSSSHANPSSQTAETDEPRPKGLGLVYCSLQHFPVRKRLRVSILKIEGLAGELRPDLEIQAFCKVNIIPGKQNKQQASVVKRGRDIVYNAEFFFDNISNEDIDTKSLAIEVFHQGAVKIQKDLEIGQILVPLKELTQLYSKKEVRIVEELKFRPNNKKLGKIQVTSCIEKDAKRLTINIVKVDDLPKWGIIGAPDVCVRITLSQNKSNPQTKSSRILKNTCTAVYKEAVMFLVSTSKNDLQHTKITISVHDVSRSVTGDDVIGSAYLGELAVDKSEVEQWKHTVDKFNKEVKGTHQLKPPNQAPDVHVSEMHSDEEVEEEEEETDLD